MFTNAKCKKLGFPRERNFVNRSKMLSTLTLKQMTMAMTAMMMALDPPMTQSQAVNREQCSTSCVLQGTRDLFGLSYKKFSLCILRIHFKAKKYLYKEHHSVCPLVEIGTPPTPFPQAIVPSPPPGLKGGGRTRLRLRGGGVPVPTTEKKA
jgi:hypothetical protein